MGEIMPLDAVCLMAVRQELENTLSNARVDKIFMPGRDEVHLTMRGSYGNARLLLSSGSSPRAHLTEKAAENPAEPPMFCMLLRKHLSGARLRGVEQPPLERALLFHFDATDELGDACHKILIIEMMGRHSNLILCGPDGRIIDCLTRVDAEMSERRQVLPGLFYRLPPAQDKQNPLEIGVDDWRALIHAAPPETAWDDWLLSRFTGLSPLVCRELSAHAPDGTFEAILSQVLHWRSRVLSGLMEPWLLLEGDRPVDFSYLPVSQYGNRYRIVRAETFSKMLDTFFTERDRQGQLKARAADMTKRLNTLCDRTRRKMVLQERELLQTGQRELLRQAGDILMANLKNVPAGAATVELFDFYHDEPREIRLEPALSAQQNAARYYKNYQRAKNAETHLTEQIKMGREELAYLDSVLEALSRAESIRDLLDIRQELVQGGYLREKTRGKRSVKTTESAPLRFVSSTGVTFWAGRNNRQNDMLTLRTAAKGDMWLHTQKIPGSHVIIPTAGSDPDETTLLEAARIAATLSQASSAGKAPVDYTQAAFVKKPPGAKPGMVIYDKYKTLMVAPDRELVERLRKP